MVIVALLEHALSVCNYVYSSTCQNDAEGAEHIFKKQFHFIFTYMPYNFVSGLVLTVSRTKIWLHFVYLCSGISVYKLDSHCGVEFWRYFYHSD